MDRKQKINRISYGYILLNINSSIFSLEDYNTIKNYLLSIKLNSENNDSLICKNFNYGNLIYQLKNAFEFLIVQRKHTYGFNDFVWGNYDIDMIDDIIFLFKQMTNDEINLIKNCNDFDKLWNCVWKIDNDDFKKSQKYIKAKEQWLKIQNNTKSLSLSFYTNYVKSIWNTYEWGFPKGKKNYGESELNCATRELYEETGFTSDDFTELLNLETLPEICAGTDDKKYKYVYSIGLMNYNININAFISNNEI